MARRSFQHLEPEMWGEVEWLLPPFSPPLSEPGSRSLENLLWWLSEVGGPVVGIGTAGPFLPQMRAPLPGALSRENLDQDWRDIDSDSDIAQPWWDLGDHDPLEPVLRDRRGKDPVRLRAQLKHLGAKRLTEIDRRRQAAINKGRWRLKDARPMLHPSEQMVASFGRHLLGLTDEHVGLRLGLKGEVLDHKTGRRRYRVASYVGSGDAHWLSVGAWPYVCFDGAPPKKWWQSTLAVDALNSWCGEVAESHSQAADKHDAMAAALRGPVAKLSAGTANLTSCDPRSRATRSSRSS